MSAGPAGGGGVSVVIPARRAARSIARAVQGCLADIGVTEVIVVLDGPDDALRAAVPDDPPVRVLTHDTPRGACAARNTGLAAARGTFVLFLDADDWVEGGLIHALAQAAAEADVTFGPYAFALPDGRRIAVDVRQTIGNPDALHVLKAWFGGLYVPPCSVLWRADFVRSIGGWDEAMLKNQDGELIWRASRAAPRVALASDGVGVYRQTPSPHRVSGNHSRAVYEQQMALLARIESELTRDERAALSAEIGHTYYRVARSAYRHGLTDIGARAETAARRFGVAGSGTRMHRVMTRLIGLRAKEAMGARWHRLRGAMSMSRNLAATQQ